MSNLLTVVEAIEQIRAAAEEYQTTHNDAGDAYSHMPREGGWCYHTNDARLAEFIQVNEIDTKGLNTEELADLVLDNFEMVPGHIFSTVQSNVFNVDSYPIGELETQVEYSTLEEMTGEALDFEKLQAINNDDQCIRENGKDCFLMYTCTDATWQAMMCASDLQDLIDDQ